MAVTIWFLTGGKFAEEMAQKVSKIPNFDRMANLKIIDARDVSYLVETGGDAARVWYKGQETALPQVVFLGDAATSYVLPLARFLESRGVYMINSVAGFELALDKLHSYEVLSAAGLPVPKTLVYHPELSVDTIIEQLGLPVVIKPNDGTQGAGVELLETREALADKCAELQDTEGIYLLQAYIATSRGRDIRVNVVDGKVISAWERKSTDPNEFRSNLHLGGEGTIVEVTPVMADVAERAAQAAGLGLCGVDLMYADDGFVIAEINGTPGLGIGDPLMAVKALLQMIQKGLGAAQ